MAERTIRQDDAGSSLMLEKGDSITVELDEPSGSGARWSEGIFSDNIMTLDRQEFEEREGGGGRRRFMLTASQPGTGAMSFELRGPDGVILDSVTVAIAVNW